MKGIQSYISLMLDNYLTSSRWFTKNLGKFIYKEFMSTHIPTVNALFTPIDLKKSQTYINFI